MKINDIEIELPEDGAIRDPDMSAIPTDDGGIEVDLDPSLDQTPSIVNSRNLADQVEPNELRKIADKLIEFVEADLESREDWENKFKEGLRRCGALKEEATTEEPVFEGSSAVIHPLIFEAAVQFQARAIDELFPAAGPVKGMVLGKKNEKVERQRERVEAHMNYQVVFKDRSYFWDVDRMLMYLPFSGSAFKKSYDDKRAGMVVSRFFEATDVIVSASATSLEDAPRITHRIRLSHNDLLKDQMSGFYSPMEDLKIQIPSQMGEDETVGQESDQVTTSTLEEDAEHIVYETSVDWDIAGLEDKEDEKETGIGLPYLISVDTESRTVLSIRRNDTEDDRYKKRIWWTHYKYLPGLGFYGWGLIHAIGGLGEAATGSMRAILDAAAFSTLQGGFKSKEARLLGDNMTIRPGEWIDTELTAEELNKAFYTPPWKEPPESMFKILGLLVESGQRFASTTETMVGEGNANTPVGTTLARIEQGMKVYSGVHKRLHKSAGEEFRLRAKLNFEYMDDTEQFQYDEEEHFIYRKDYGPPIDVVPVSDPNIFSQTQRIALAQSLLQISSEAEGLYDQYAVHKRVLQYMKVPDIDELLPDPNEIKMVDPISEGVNAMMGKPVRAWPEQDHQAHIMIHQTQIEMVAGTPAEEVLPGIMSAHIAEHMGMEYRVRMMNMIGVRIPEPGDEDDQMPPQVERELSLRAAIALQQQKQESGPSMEERMAAAALEETEAKSDKLRAEADRTRNEIDEGEGGGEGEQVDAVRADMRKLLEDTTRAHEEELGGVREELLRVKMDAQNREEESKSRADSDKYKADKEKETKIAVAKIEAESDKKTEKITQAFDKQMDALKSQLKDALKAAEEAKKIAEKATKDAEAASKETQKAITDASKQSDKGEKSEAAPSQVHVHIDKGSGNVTKVIELKTDSGKSVKGSVKTKDA